VKEEEKKVREKKEKKRERRLEDGRWLVGPGRKRTLYRSRMVGPIAPEIP
jgi:hypothetical protein